MSYPEWLQQQGAALLERAGKLDDCFSTVEIDITWGAMDAYQHVNNVAYFRYIEIARIQYLSDIGWSPMERGVISVLGRVGTRFVRPLVFPDRITIGTRPLVLEDSKLIVEHVIRSSKLGELVAVGKSVIVAFDTQQGKKTKIPEKVHAAVRAHLGVA